MWSMWNAPSDRDYYEPYGRDEEDEEPEYCQHCGARWDQPCEEWCDTNAPASEAPSAGQTEPGASPGIPPASSRKSVDGRLGSSAEGLRFGTEYRPAMAEK